MDSIPPSTNGRVASSSTSKPIILPTNSKAVADAPQSPWALLSEDPGSSSSIESEDGSSEHDHDTDPLRYDPDFPAVTRFTVPKTSIASSRTSLEFLFHMHVLSISFTTRRWENTIVLGQRFLQYYMLQRISTHRIACVYHLFRNRNSCSSYSIRLGR